MLSGRDALKSIERAIAEVRSEQESASAKVREMTDSMARLKSAESGAFQKLAEVRLGSIRKGELADSLNRSERRAAELIADHAQDLDRLEADIAAGEAERKKLIQARAKAADKADAAQTAFDTELAAFQASFRKTPVFRKAEADAQEAERVVVEAERKAQIATDDRTEKGAPYEADPLFMYLWERKFGTGDYTGRGITRLLDRWVAGIVGYMDASANYRMLLEIPKRLSEHVESQRKKLDAARETLQRIETDARGKQAIGKSKEALDAAEAALAALDEKIAAESARRNALEAERGQMVRGDDTDFQQAIALLSAELSRQDLRALHREARLTVTREDEEIVNAIDDLRADIDDIEDDLERQRESLASLDRRRSELESVRQRYVGNRYDDAGSYFEKDSFLKDLLMGVLSGVLSGGGMWREIERQHRRRTKASPDFGWRRFPSPGSGPVLRPGRRSRGGGIFGGGGRRGGSGGGGFRTGGGF